ncbi:hypothetical protein BM1_09616 [Bipolaris maydis]|nr:hypothetical protein BM1_09616 [Bipolaris maydis]
MERILAQLNQNSDIKRRFPAMANVAKVMVKAEVLYKWSLEVPGERQGNILICENQNDSWMRIQTLAVKRISEGSWDGDWKYTMVSCTANTMTLGSEHIWKRARFRAWTHRQPLRQTHQKTYRHTLAEEA